MSSISADNREVRVTSKREMNPFQFHWETYGFLFQESRKKKDETDIYKREGWYNLRASGIVFLAFWVEAYLNYVLEEVFSLKQFKIFERISVEKKLELFNEKYNILMDYTIFRKLLETRNSLAHGKNHVPDPVTDVIPLSVFNNSQPNEFINANSMLDAEWEKYLDKLDEYALANNLEKELEKLFKVSGVKFHPKGLGDLVMHSAEVIS